MGQALIAVVTAMGVSLAPVVAKAGCANDMDCKGDRVCEEGVCVDPAPDMQPQPDPESLRSRATQAPQGTDAGWNRGAAIVGIVSAVLILAFGSVSIYFNENPIDEEELNVGSLAAGGVATLFAMALIPVAGVGANSGDVHGPVGLRIAGWVGYGLTVINALALLGLGAADVDVSSGPIASTVLLGVLSSLCFTTSGFIATSRAEMASVSTPRILPVASAVRTPRGNAQPTLGLAVTF